MPEEIKEIIDNNNQKPIIKNINKIKPKYIYLYKSKTFVFYICNKKKKQYWKTKVNIQKKILQITEYCIDNITHEKLEYEKKKINLINFKEKYIKKYYIHLQQLKIKKQIMLQFKDFFLISQKKNL